ncbi:MAG: hypothetical protein KAI82_01285, partial [Tritonibacter mobilis]|nr:hypothetical protein [Tritonibacter mobilis]
MGTFSLPQVGDSNSNICRGSNYSDSGGGADGADGVPVELQASATHIQWRLVGAATWIDLVL